MSRLEDKKAPIEEIPSTECKVIPQQPLLQMKSDNLSQGSLMLYEGERCGREDLSSTKRHC